jgi:hypothetical protein
MLNINLHFDGSDEIMLREKKEKSGLTWEEFVLVSAGVRRKEDFE